MSSNYPTVDINAKAVAEDLMQITNWILQTEEGKRGDHDAKITTLGLAAALLYDLYDLQNGIEHDKKKGDVRQEKEIAFGTVCKILWQYVRKEDAFAAAEVMRVIENLMRGA